MDSPMQSDTKFFGVINPAIPRVLDAEKGEEIDVYKLLNTDEASLIQLRLKVKVLIQEDRAKYLCPECFVPVGLVCRKETFRFFFRHSHENGRCSAVTRGEFSQADINARKYNGAKESLLHIEMKQWLAESLHASRLFTSIVQEARWKGPITGAWRKPDVSAFYGDIKIAFEIQLSTTFLDVIAERWRFYKHEGGLLFWVFAKFDDDGRRLTQNDVFFNNNQNAFIVSKETRDASVAAGEFLMDCAWSDPALTIANPPLVRARVSFTQLTLDTGNQQAFYFDYKGEKNRIAENYKLQQKNWAIQFEEWWLQMANQKISQYNIQEDLKDFPQNAPQLWRGSGILSDTPLKKYGRGEPIPAAMLNAFYSAKHGRPIGQRRHHFIEVVHYVAESYPNYLRWFRQALNFYKRGELIKQQDVSGKWEQRKRKYIPLLCARDKKYEPEVYHLELFEWLFPELVPFPI